MAYLTYDQLKQKCLEFTSYNFETSTLAPDCYGVVAGNFDGAGISFGAIQWNLGSQTLQPILLSMINNYESVTKTAFQYSVDPSYYNTFKTVITTYSVSDQITWGDSISNPSNKHLLIEPWKSYFNALGITSQCIALELNATQWYFDLALQFFDQYATYAPVPVIYSKRAYALFFDIAVQQGGISTTTRNLILYGFDQIDTVGKTAGQIETEKMVIIANAVADAVNPTWQASVRERKLSIANGSGTLVSYGGWYVDTNDYDLNLEAAFTAPTTSGYFQNYAQSERPSKVQGCDISHWQTDYPHNFVSAYNQSCRFVVIKAGGTVGDYYLAGGTGHFDARYIRCTVNGSYTNTSSIFGNIEAWDSTGVDRAYGKTVTGSKASPDYGYPTASYANFTDGDPNTWVLVGDNTQYVQVDLGATYHIRRVNLWHYPGRIFKSNKVEYSTDGTNWTTLFDSATNGEYNESNPMGQFVPGRFYKGIADRYAQDAAFAAAGAFDIASARAAGLKVGFYWFKNPCYVFSGAWRNSAGDGSSEASLFWQYITSAIGLSDWADTFVWLDWEENQGGTIFPAADNDTSYEFIKAFCDTISYLTGGRKCGIYTAWFCLDGQAATTSNVLVHSVDGGLGSATWSPIPLWYSQIIDTPYGSAYPNRYGWSQGLFGGWSAWTMWQYSYQNQASEPGQPSALTYGFAGGGDIDCDICENALVNILQPTHVSALAGVGAATTITLTWTTGETDLQGYMYSGSGIATATIAVGIGSATILNLSSNTSYAITMYAFDLYEISPATSVTVDTSEAISNYHTLLCFKA
jgi:hypothetical protein